MFPQVKQRQILSCVREQCSHIDLSLSSRFLSMFPDETLCKYTMSWRSIKGYGIHASIKSASLCVAL